MKPRKSKVHIIPRAVGGNSIEFTLPKTIADLMEVTPGKRLELEFHNGKYGKYIAIWNYDQQKREQGGETCPK